MSGKIKNILINTASAVFTVIARTVGILLYVMIYFMDAIVLSLITSYFMVTKKDPVRHVNPILIRWMLLQNYKKATKALQRKLLVEMMKQDEEYNMYDS